MSEAFKIPKVLSLAGEEYALTAISSIDGRYTKSTKELNDCSSEFALMHYRLFVEIEYLMAIAKELGIHLSDTEIEFFHHTQAEFKGNIENGLQVKEIEKTTNHDLKSVEIFLVQKLKKHSFPNKILSLVHFGLTSQDVDNIARTLMIIGQGKILKAEIKRIYSSLQYFAKEFASLPMLSRTHGQPATPTTFGKEMAVYCERLNAQIKKIEGFKFSAKFGGATGNMNAHVIAYPKVGWKRFADEFVKNITNEGVIYRRQATTQIDSYDTHAEYFSIIQRINSICTDLCRDLWMYISNEIVIQKPKEGEVGSSTMPHKVNPIDFENAEGNFEFANVQLQFYQTKLMTSRMQRDLTDSTVVRNFGSTLGYCLIGYKSLLRGLGKISPNESSMKEELRNHPEVITEAIQTILRREGITDAYDQLKDFSRGEKLTMEIIHSFIDSLSVSDLVKDELKQITPENYIGYAVEIAQDCVD